MLKTALLIALKVVVCFSLVGAICLALIILIGYGLGKVLLPPSKMQESPEESEIVLDK